MGPGLGMTGAAAPGGLGTAPMGWYQKLLSGMFGGTDPEANRAMMQMGMGLLSGQNLAQAYGGAANTYQGAMDRAYQQAETTRKETREDAQRKEDREWRQEDRNAQQEFQEAQAQLDREQRLQIARMQAGDDQARAKIAQLEHEEKQKRQKMLEPIIQRIQDGTATATDIQIYGLFSGRAPAVDPVMGGYIGFGQAPTPGAAPGMSTVDQLANDPDL